MSKFAELLAQKKDISDLLEQRQAIDQQIELIRAEQRETAISQVRAILDESGLLISDLANALDARYSGFPKPDHKGYSQSVHKAPGKGTKAARTSVPVPAKYRDPVSGKTWSGRGLRPRWLTDAIGSGKLLEEFAVKD